jgi:hypothetical protein
MLSALLVQLFGREVVDRLLAAGYDNAETIAAAGAERLAEEGAISIALARRVVAVALEDVDEPDPLEEAVAPVAEDVLEAAVAPMVQDDSSKGPDHEAGIGTAPAPRGSATPPDRHPEGPGKHVRRPFRRPHAALDSSPSLTHADRPGAEPRAAATKGKGGEPGRKREPREKRPQGPEERPGGRQPEPRPMDDDPFVDDVGLVAWMGTAGRQGSPPGGSRTVAEEILDPGPPIAAPPEPAKRIPAPPGPWGKPVVAKEGTGTAAAPRKPAPSSSFRLVHPPVNGSANRVLVENSFWSFGAPLRPRSEDRTTPAEAAGKRPAPSGPKEPAGVHGGQPSPRRRVHDGH